jgi:hypothetical protein
VLGVVQRAYQRAYDYQPAQSNAGCMPVLLSCLTSLRLSAVKPNIGGRIPPACLLTREL